MIRLIVFASRDARDFVGARELARTVGARFVDRLTADLEELRLVARYGVVEAVVIVGLRGDEVVFRIPRVIDADELRAVLQGLT